MYNFIHSFTLEVFAKTNVVVVPSAVAFARASVRVGVSCILTGVGSVRRAEDVLTDTARCRSVYSASA
jgi:hypothetical protein